jgi:predicted ATPase
MQLGETPQLFLVLRGLRVVYEERGALRQAQEQAEQMLGLAQRAQDPGRLVRAHSVLGSTLFLLGEFASARTHLAQGIALSDAIQDLSAALRDGDQIHGSRCRQYLASTLWSLGSPAQALQQSHGAIALAEELVHPYSVAYALYRAAVLHGLRREAQAAQACAEAVIALARQHEFPGMVARGTVLRGWALAAQGQETEGIAQMHQGMDTLQSLAVEVQRPYRLALLAEAFGRVGQTAEARCILDEALALAHQYGAHFYKAEVHRLTGELLLMQDAGGDVSEPCFCQALDIARRQQAKSLDLRAAMSLSRLWQQHGRRTDAYQLLAPIYGWFTEGFDTADLQDAKALLDVLA